MHGDIDSPRSHSVILTSTCNLMRILSLTFKLPLAQCYHQPSQMLSNTALHSDACSIVFISGSRL